MLPEKDGIAGPLQAALAPVLTAIASLKQALDTLPPPEDETWYHETTSRLGALLPQLYAAYDRYLAAVLLAEDRKVTCSRGCSACCRHFVSSVEPFELLALDHHLKSRADYGGLVVSTFRKTMLYEEILREEGGDEEAEDRALYRYFLRGQACPFLAKDGTCGVYEWRPMSCRMFYAESSPRFCAGKELASPWNKNFQVELPQEAEEALARCSRVLEHLGLSENLFTGLVEVNAAFGRHDAGDGTRDPAGADRPPTGGQAENPGVSGSAPESR
jgi:Fe-S-cluster containining protein